MARKPRIHYPGAFYHVMLRGNGGQDIFFSDADRSRFYLFLVPKLLLGNEGNDNIISSRPFVLLPPRFAK